MNHASIQKIVLTLVVVCVIIAVVFLYPQPAVQPTARAATINHIVFIVKENHTFDSMFGSYQCLDSSGNRTVNCVNGATTGQVFVNGADQTIQLNVAPDAPANFTHAWNAAHTDANGGKMDMFNVGEGGCGTAPYSCMVTGTASLAPNYWSYADHYVLDDNGFTSEESPSYDNHLFTVAGQSGATVNNSPINNPNIPTSSGTGKNNWGCDSPAGTTVQLYAVNSSGKHLTIYPCFDNQAGHGQTYQTFADEMNANHISWRYYTVPSSNVSGHIWDALRFVSYCQNQREHREIHAIPERCLERKPSAV